MHFKNNSVKFLRLLLFPISAIYGVVILVRNFLFDKKWLRSVKFDLPVICVGNLSVGGTGKSPMVEYLVTILREKYKLGIVSRGYGRDTKGFVLAGDSARALEIGDEPLQFKIKFPEVQVAVGEHRLEAIPQLLYNDPDVEVIILDDAFQHRRVRAGFNILLSEYGHLYHKDYLLPVGNLRDIRRSANRSDIIMVTKCPPSITEEDKKKLHSDLKVQPHQHLYLASLHYDTPYHLFTNELREITPNTTALMVSAIASPDKLKTYLKHTCLKVVSLTFSDHHKYSEKNVQMIKTRIAQITGDEKMIVITSKDAAKLREYNGLEGLPIYVLPIRHKILLGEEDHFKKSLYKTIEDIRAESHVSSLS